MGPIAFATHFTHRPETRRFNDDDEEAQFAPSRHLLPHLPLEGRHLPRTFTMKKPPMLLHIEPQTRLQIQLRERDKRSQ